MPKPLLTLDEVNGCWAIMPTPAIEDASDWRQDFTVDLDETARVASELVLAGVDGILTLGTFGECSTLTWEEKRAFMATVVEAVDDRVPVFGGTTSLNTRESIRQTREAEKLGVRGVMLGIPMWCAADTATAVQFYRDVAEACPNIAICVYANHEAFKFEFTRGFWAAVSEIPQVVAAKYLGVGTLCADLNVSQRRIRFLPIDVDYYAAARIDPEFCTAFWSSSAVCGPAPVARLKSEVIRARREGDWACAKEISDAIGKTYKTLFPKDSFKDFAMYNIGLEKVRMDEAGWMTAGPCRPPYHLVPDAYLEGAREAGRRWASLHRECLNTENGGGKK